MMTVQNIVVSLQHLMMHYNLTHKISMVTHKHIQ